MSKTYVLCFFCLWLTTFCVQLSIFGLRNQFVPYIQKDAITNNRNGKDSNTVLAEVKKVLLGSKFLTNDVRKLINKVKHKNEKLIDIDNLRIKLTHQFVKVKKNYRLSSLYSPHQITSGTGKQ